MENINKIYPLIVMVLMLCFSACDEEPTQALEDIIKEDKGYLPVIATFTLISPDEPNVQPGMESAFDLRYWSEGTLDKIQFWLILNEEETLMGEQAYVAAYSHVTRTDSLIFNYTMPVSLQPGDNIVVEARVFNEGLQEYPAISSIAISVLE